MKPLKDILYRVEISSVIGTTNLHISSVEFDSRKVKKQSLFVAVKGTETDGHEYISQAIKNGAIAIVVEQTPAETEEGINYIVVKDSSKALAVLAANYFDNPAEKIKLIGVTGTNGKTTIVSLLHDLFLDMEKKVGMLSTINNKINNQVIESTHTTGDALQINQLLAEMLT